MCISIIFRLNFLQFQGRLGQIVLNLDVKMLSSPLAKHPTWPPWLLIDWKGGNHWKSLDGMKPNLIQILLKRSLSKIVSLYPNNYTNIQYVHHSWLCNFVCVSIILFLISDLRNIFKNYLTFNILDLCPLNQV